MIRRDHLEIIHALSRTGTLTSAAEALHLTQSALSHAMRRLEEQAGVALWEPDGRRIRLTQAGEYLRSIADRIVPQLAHADLTLAGYAEGRLGTLRVGMECHPCYEWFLTILPRFLAEHPAIDVDVIQRHQFSGIEALETHQIDLLLTPDPLTAEEIEFEPLFPYEMRLAARVDMDVPLHREGTEERYVDGNAFLHLDLLTYPVGRERLDLFTRLLIPEGIEPRSVRAVEATEVMLELVRAGRGVTALPDWMVERLGNEVASYRIGRDGIHKHLAVGYRRGSEMAPYVGDFLVLAGR